MPLPTYLHPDYRWGWHPSPPDFRDLQHEFRAPPSLLHNLPDEIDLATPALPAPYEPVIDQAAEGSCGPHFAAADLIYAALAQEKLPSVPMPSRNYIYYVTRVIQGTVSQDSGVNLRSLCKALATYGWCDESLWPYDPATLYLKPPAECFAQAATRRAPSYHSVPQDLDTMRACLAGGDPFGVGFSVYSSMLTGEVDRTGLVPMPSGDDSLKGGHAVQVVGYSVRKRTFRFKNWWKKADGTPWGQGGYGEIPFDYLSSPRYSGDFWTFTKSGLTAPAPAPARPSGKKTVLLSVPVTVDFDAGTVSAARVA